MALMLANFPQTTLASPISSAIATTVAVTAADSLPNIGAVLDANYYYAVIQDTSGNWEIVKVRSATAATGNATLTVARGAEGSTAKASFASGSAFYVPLTLQNFQDYVATIAASFPAQANKNGQVLTTNGSAVSWGSPLPALSTLQQFGV